MKGTLFIISSPSGGGKGTLIREARKGISNLSYSVSYTTREIREGEAQGKNYFFVSVDEFKSLIDKDEFLEYAEVHGNFYGTSKSQVEKEIDAGNDIILEIDVQGAEIVRSKVKGSVNIFILPPSYDVLKSRLLNRKTESASDLKIRLSNAVKEVSEYKKFDFVIVNDDKEIAADELKTVFRGERLRTDRQETRIRDILNSFENAIED
ncbi:MAG: guanylate kinase [Pyrinomonadaceae bacterium]|nr:guanylate kinase [Pyrinomonadaceae bacterium]